MTAYVQLGKLGDQLSALPIVQHEFETTGIKPHVLVAKPYDTVLQRVPYAEPVIYSGPWDDLRGAVKFAKQNFETVVVTQTYGHQFPIQKTRSSFQLEAWHRAGKLHLWDTLPLTFTRDRHSEMELMSSLGAINKRYILFADHSQSSPFLQKDECFKLLQDWAAKQKVPRLVIRLSDIQLPHLCDFLPIYDGADAIVAVESAHLHLTKATKRPVLALATDMPTRWHGSAWSKRYSFYCRYSEWNDRKSEMIEALDGTVTLKQKIETMVLE